MSKKTQAPKASAGSGTATGPSLDTTVAALAASVAQLALAVQGMNDRIDRLERGRSEATAETSEEESKEAPRRVVNALSVPTGDGAKTRTLRGTAAAAAHVVGESGKGKPSTLKRKLERARKALKSQTLTADERASVEAQVLRLTERLAEARDRRNFPEEPAAKDKAEKNDADKAG